MKHLTAKSVSILILSVLASNVWAGQVIFGPTTSTTGDYTLSWNEACRSPDWFELKENSTYYQLGCASSKSFSGKAPGTYVYELYHCELDVILGLFCIGGPMIGWDSHTVTVTSCQNSGSTNNDTVRTGDHDGDGRTDLFVGSSISRPIVLRQRSDKTFQQINLTDSQIDCYSAWPVQNNLKVHHSDFNVDGETDVAVLGIDSVVAGAGPEIVYSTLGGSTNTNPSHVRAITPDMQEFVGDTFGLMSDFYYLQNRMYQVRAVSWESYGYKWAWFNSAYLQFWDQGNENGPYVLDSDDPFDDTVEPTNCSIYSCQFNGDQWQIWVYAEDIRPVWDYSIFNPNTMTLAQTMDLNDAGYATIDDLLDVIEQVLGVVSCLGLNTSEIDTFDSVHTMDYFRINTCTFVLIGRMLDIISDEPYVVNGNTPQGTKLQFRAHLVGGQWSRPFNHIYHGSVHHPGLGQPWYSGYPENGSAAALVNLAGNLEKHNSDPRDSIRNAPLVGYIDLDAGLTLGGAWTTVTAGFFGYDDNLQYCLFPEKWSHEGKCEGYNSNSFAMGLVKLVGGVEVVSYPASGGVPALAIPITVHNFPGAAKEVPESAFQ